MNQSSASTPKEKIDEQYVLSLEKRLGILQIQNVELERQKSQLEGELGVGRLFTDGLPSLGGHNVSASQTPAYGDHTACKTLIVQDDAVLKVLDAYSSEKLPKNLSSKIWKQVDAKPGEIEKETLGEWSGEIDIQTFVTLVMNDAVALAKGVDSKWDLSIYRECQLSMTEHLRPDVVVFRSRGVVVGVCEVKKPSRRGGDLDNESLRNQISNYMLRLKHSHGLKAVFGITTTYNEWRFCWLDEAKTIAESTILISDVFNDGVSQDDEQIVHQTKIFSRNDPDLIEALVSVICKMAMCPVCPPTSLLRNASEADPRRFAQVDAASFKWCSLPPKWSEDLLSYDSISTTTKKFYLIEDFHGGADGRVWLSITESGKVGVLKLSSETNFANELQVWNDVWKVGARVLKIIDCNALLMPFAFRGRIIEGQVKFIPFGVHGNNDFGLEKYNSSEVKASFDLGIIEIYSLDPWRAANEALDAMATAGYVHKDVSWRHVALLPVRSVTDSECWTVKPILIDCFTAVKLDDRLQLDKFVEDSKEVLRMELAECGNLRS